MNSQGSLSIDQLVSMISSLPTGVALFEIVDLTFSLIYANDVAYSYLGRTREESKKFFGKEAAKSIYPDDLPRLYKNIESLKQADSFYSDTIRVISHNQEYIPFNVKIQNYNYSSTKSYAIVYISYTKAQNFSTFISTVNNSTMPLIGNSIQKVISTEFDEIFLVHLNDQYCTTIYCNPESKALVLIRKYGYFLGSEKFLKEHYAGSNLFEFQEKVKLESILNALKKESVYIVNTTIKSEKGIIQKRAYFTYADESKQNLFIAHQDVSKGFKEEENQKKLLREALQKAEKAISTKNDFLAHINHDIRTPLNAIMGLTNLAKEVKDKPDEVLYFLNKIEASGQLMTGLINDVLDMSQIESSHLELHPESYRYEDFCNTIIAPFKTQCEEKHINLIFKQENLPTVMVDRQRFNQIFYNLLSNAIKYSIAGDTITYSVENIKTKNNMFVADFIVSDSGVGFSHSHLEQLNTFFKKTKLEDIRNGSGLGLGLIIVKAFVLLLGGKIKVESNKGRGTKFTISLALPIVQTSKKSESSLLDYFSTLSGKTILLVEDNDLNREIAYRQLEKKNIRVIQAINGEDALKIFMASEPGSFNAILMDIQMPVMNGYKATKAIRALNRPDALSTPIIAMSANGMVEDIKESLAAGMVSHLTKPIDLDQLYGTLAAFCTN